MSRSTVAGRSLHFLRHALTSRTHATLLGSIRGSTCKLRWVLWATLPNPNISGLPACLLPSDERHTQKRFGDRSWIGLASRRPYTQRVAMVGNSLILPLRRQRSRYRLLRVPGCRLLPHRRTARPSSRSCRVPHLPPYPERASGNSSPHGYVG